MNKVWTIIIYRYILTDRQIDSQGYIYEKLYVDEKLGWNNSGRHGIINPTVM